MIKISHILIIIIASSAGFIFLWLERLYSNIPLFGNLTAITNDGIIFTFALLISVVTSPGIALTIVIIAALLAIHDHHIRLWWFSTGLLITGIAASTLMKNIIMLPRPEYGLIKLSTYGFPSTHATLATIICIVGIWLTYNWRNISHRKTILYTLIIGWIIICLSRMLLGVHSTSDVLAGVLLGSIISSMGILVAPLFLHRSSIIMANRHEIN